MVFSHPLPLVSFGVCSTNQHDAPQLNPILHQSVLIGGNMSKKDYTRRLERLEERRRARQRRERRKAAKLRGKL
jgi:hypothetical protein